MSKIDHKNFLTSAGEFAERAVEATCLAELQAWFAKALGRERVIAYECQGILAGRKRIGPAAGPGIAVGMAVDALDGTSMTVTMWTSVRPDPMAMARLHLLAVLYVTHAVVLAEVDEACAASGRDALERQCSELADAGMSHLEIGERFGISPQAVGIQLRRAARARRDIPTTH